MGLRRRQETQETKLAQSLLGSTFLVHGLIRGAAGYGLLHGSSPDLCKLAIASYVLEMLFAAQMVGFGFAKPKRMIPLFVRAPLHCACSRAPWSLAGPAMFSAQVCLARPHGGLAVPKSVASRPACPETCDVQARRSLPLFPTTAGISPWVRDTWSLRS